MLIFAFREYGAIDDVDIDLHIDVSFLDVSISWSNMIGTFKKHTFILGRNLILVSLVHNTISNIMTVKVIYEEMLWVVKKAEILYTCIFFPSVLVIYSETYGLVVYHYFLSFHFNFQI